ncbi:carboxymuconolactone decarboxylase family protein [Hahella aquimaris]|uniref:carboxymuconolactone decarboxylase family protein n=1 Tax=Hahella sp. HNIBRBA332 TaxID=3015983 RepID=UPI00273B2B29|nr:carboxymuconolactone decarboxylase family protein [Hahella sp. HNIBRBA332]WLQ11632.1 carboxymuconolactone decarboxylase family protein [Hahella sp. HNIBRBA332]
MMMSTRIALAEIPKPLYAAMMTAESYIRGTGLATELLELVRLRASQINGCAYCVDMHYKDAVAEGVDPLKLNAVAVWREMACFDDKERAALALTETLTLLAEQKVEDALMEKVISLFGHAQAANLVLAIAQINSWNRLAKTFAYTPGDYQVGQYS